MSRGRLPSSEHGAHDRDDVVVEIARGRLCCADQAGCFLPCFDHHGCRVLHGCAWAGELAAPVADRIRNDADRGGDGGAESLHRARVGSVYAADGFAAAAERCVAAGAGAGVWYRVERGRRVRAVLRRGMDRGGARRCDLRRIFVRIYTAEEADSVGDVHWCVSGGDSADDRVGCGDGFTRSRGVAAVWDFVLVAISALLRDCVDVSRRLRACGDSDAAGGRSRREADVSADYLDGGWVDWRIAVAVGRRIGRDDVFFWGAGGESRVVAGLCLGGVDEDECAGEVADACDGDAYTGVVGINGLRQDSAVMWLDLTAKIRKQRTVMKVNARASWGAAVLRPYTDSAMDDCVMGRMVAAAQSCTETGA